MNQKIEFHVGQEVRDLLIGDGVVIRIQSSDDRPVIVEFPDGDIRAYRGDGRLYKSHIMPKLYKAGTKVIVKEPIFKPCKGETIIVWNNKERYVKQFDHMDYKDEYVVRNTVDENGSIIFKTYKYACPMNARH